MRFIVARLIAPVMAHTGFRFTKDYRWGMTIWHKMVFAVCSTVEANYRADQIIEEA
jgi:hypothetical protein